VVEGAERSGSLITAREALDQGREVMAVPGSPLDPRAGGCNALIREGATLVRSAADVLEALAASLDAAPVRQVRAAPPTRPDPPTPGDAGRLVELLGHAPTPEDALTRALGRPAPVVAALLLELELEGRILRHPGGAVSLAPG
jgi:DNA processing protein